MTATKGEVVVPLLANGGEEMPSQDSSTMDTPQESTPASPIQDGEAEASTKVDKESSESNPKITYGPASAGALAVVHNLYQSPPDEHDEWTWTEEYPKNVQEVAENEESAKCALIVRNVKGKDGLRKMKAHSIVVQSPHLKQALGEVLADYPGVTCELQRLEFEQPFKPFVHRWSAFLRYRERSDLEPVEKEHLDLLHKILQIEIGDSIREYEDFVLNGVITYKSLWMIFAPGSIVLSNHKSVSISAFELVDTEYLEDRCIGKYLNLECNVVAYDGKDFKYRREDLKIRQFTGTKKITSLRAFPFAFAENKEELQESLVSRGKQYEELAGYNFRAYNGPAITWDDRGNEMTIHIEGRVVIDYSAWERYVDSNVTYNIDEMASFTEKDYDLIAGFYKDESTETVNADCEIGVINSCVPQQRTKLSPHHRMLCQSRLSGYSLKTKKWLDFHIEYVRDITWNSKALQALVLPPGQKDLVLAFSESHLNNRAVFDDVISGKGRGMIMLLAGSPGVGKTLTAEAVAEFMRRPLHSVTSGELGSTAYEIENSLTEILDLVSRWNAVLLIDECDVFLEKRDAHDLDRNQIVSIFLRTLEYYEGIMFMTTNRAQNIDAAFQSRIHIAIDYPDLTLDSRLQIWKKLLEHSKVEHEFDEFDFMHLAAWPLNGRQIKNILRSSQLLAMSRKKPLTRELVEVVHNIEKGKFSTT